MSAPAQCRVAHDCWDYFFRDLTFAFVLSLVGEIDCVYVRDSQIVVKHYDVIEFMSIRHDVRSNWHVTTIHCHIIDRSTTGLMGTHVVRAPSRLFMCAPTDVI